MTGARNGARGGARDGARDGAGALRARIADVGDDLTPAERRVAAVVADDPRLVAFGTVAEVAARADASGPTVLRFAGKLGYDGFASLKAEVQDEIAGALRPATQRIRERSRGDLLARAAAIEVANVQATLDAVDPHDLERTVALFADRRRAVHVLAGESCRALGRGLADQLDLLRAGVQVIEGSPVAVGRRIAAITPNDVVVVIDLRRYERWVVDAARAAAERGATLVAITDGPLSPFVPWAAHTFTVAARGVGPFDSHAGGLALVNVLAAAVAGRLRRSAAARLDATEAAWAEASDLVEG
jgi:DNA-binding MurR/RpiR family transcriptional regulator